MDRSVRRDLASEPTQRRRQPAPPRGAREQTIDAAKRAPDRASEPETRHGLGTLSPTGMDQDPLG